MKSITFSVKGHRGHFKRPASNDNPTTFSFMHKSALIGLVGAVTGIERIPMRDLYPQLCDDFMYAITLLTPIRKKSESFTKRISSEQSKMGRRYCEYLMNISYEITLVLKNERSKEIFDAFCECVENEWSVYNTTLGNANCFADLTYISMDEVSDEIDGETTLSTVFSADDHKILSERDKLDLIFERIPTHAANNYYTPSRIIQTVCSSSPLKIQGPYHNIGNKSICLL